MDETQLVFIGHRHWFYGYSTLSITVTSSAKIAVLDFGQNKPFCEKHPRSYSVLSAYRELGVLEYFPRNYASITRNIPCYRSESYSVTSAGSRKYSNYCTWFALSAYACFVCYVLIRDVRKLNFRVHAIF
jgi:hypothetical protein